MPLIATQAQIEHSRSNIRLDSGFCLYDNILSGIFLELAP